MSEMDEVTMEELESLGYTGNKTKDKKYDKEKLFKITKDNCKDNLLKIGDIVYAEDYKGKKRILIRSEGLSDATVRTGRCEHCKRPYYKLVPDCKWYYSDMLEEYEGE